LAKTPKEQAQAHAEASFKRKEQQARDGKRAVLDYEAAGQAMREKTARLRSLRLAQEDADKAAAEKKPAAAPKKKKR